MRIAIRVVDLIRMTEQIEGRGVEEENTDQFRFLGNGPPTPPLTQHFALGEKEVFMLT